MAYPVAREEVPVKLDTIRRANPPAARPVFSSTVLLMPSWETPHYLRFVTLRS